MEDLRDEKDLFIELLQNQIKCLQGTAKTLDEILADAIGKKTPDLPSYVFETMSMKQVRGG